MSEEEIKAIFGSKEAYAQRKSEIGIENKIGPIAKRIRYEKWRSQERLISYEGKIERRG
jgi:hypothetical protein